MHTNQKTCTGHTPVALSWGLPRISYSGPIEDGLPDHYNYDTDKFSGNGVKVYIIDTGILTTHQDFAPNRAEWGIAIAPGGNVDGNGHGTHCAGTAVGTQFGVAKRAHVVAVKVLGAGGSGTIADVVAGIDWVTANGVPGKAVGSMSLGATGNFPTITTAVNNAVLKGIPIVVAAGNSNGDACNYSPAGVASAICVGASEIAGAEGGEFDSRSSFSNWGRCLTLFAPGRDINSAWIGSNTATRVISGTSMACPHVAGQVACILSSDPSPISPQVVKDQLVATSLKYIIANAGTASPNLLLHNECHR
jgi:subtilisin family serine protease